jgi:6-pyruvoyltetrahydropterin/6-carboxytetrahydropterin synthase
MIVYKKFTIESARSLPNLPESHPCKKVHGHSFKIIICLKGAPDKTTGFVLDFNDIDKAFNPIKKKIDHVYLNDIEGLENPSSENLCIWIWKRLKIKLPELFTIEIKETSSTGCIYKGT